MGSAEGGCAFQMLGGEAHPLTRLLCASAWWVGRSFLGPLRADGTQGHTADGAALGPGFRHPLCRHLSAEPWVIWGSQPPTGFAL